MRIRLKSGSLKDIREVERTGNKEVRVEAFYDMDSALQAFKQATREELKNRGVELGKQLDELMGF